MEQQQLKRLNNILLLYAVSCPQIKVFNFESAWQRVSTLVIIIEVGYTHTHTHCTVCNKTIINESSGGEGFNSGALPLMMCVFDALMILFSVFLGRKSESISNERKRVSYPSTTSSAHHPKFVSRFSLRGRSNNIIELCQFSAFPSSSSWG